MFSPFYNGVVHMRKLAPAGDFHKLDDYLISYRVLHDKYIVNRKQKLCACATHSITPRSKVHAETSGSSSF